MYLGETIIAIIAALGGTAGIVSIINAFKNKTRSEEEEIQLFKKAFEESGTKESLICLLRHEITSIYYQHIDDKKLSVYEKQNLLMMYEQYEKLGGNSYVHSIIKEMELWER